MPETKKPTKNTTAKPEVKAVKKDTKPGAEAKIAKSSGLSIELLSLSGKSAGNLELPKEVFGAKINQSLLSQALRVYLSNEKGHHSSTKTRGEVEGSTRKIFKQKGTGRARHGAIRASIFVGGGIALGPKIRRETLDLPKQMRLSALVSALSQKTKDGGIKAVADLEKASGKTKELAGFVKSLGSKTVLFVVEGEVDKARRASRNLPGVSMLKANELNLVEVIRHQNLVLTKEAVKKLEQRLVKTNKRSEEKTNA